MKPVLDEAWRQKERERWEQAQEAKKWFEQRRTMTVLTPEQQKAHEEYLAANPDLPF